MSPDFSKAHLEATKLLLKQDITDLNIDVREFNYDKKIVIDSVQHYSDVVHRDISCFTTKEFNGSCFIEYCDHDLYVVLYDENEPYERKKHWGIAHEIGHIYLGHTQDGEKEEIEAHFFAAQLIVPEIVLLYYAKLNGGHIDSSDIYSSFNCSFRAANKRIKTLQSNVWSFNKYDRQLLTKFKPIIEKKLIS